ncbi:MAG: hypothetical protein LC649_10580 [Bacteroidales bacterium]|nr:hypothetical protein [Bacteroidales bacterium]
MLKLDLFTTEGEHPYKTGSLRHGIWDSFSAPLLVALLFITAPLSGQQNDNVTDYISSIDTVVYTLDDNLNLFSSHEVLDINLELDLTAFLSDRFAEEYFEGKITLQPGTPDARTSELRLKARGNRRLELCPFPPIRLNFRMKGEEGDDIVTNLKLVSHCNTARQFELYLFREYMAYRMYNVITDESFRVRLLRINYIDTGEKKLSQVRYAFVIEPTEMFARRKGMVEIDNVLVRPDQIEPGAFDRVALFQYMIGNDDWYLANLHNLKVFAHVGGPGSLPVVVPYDFDYSGFVNTHYAVPNPEHNISSVHEVS